jgi:hypothetical protein
MFIEMPTGQLVNVSNFDYFEINESNQPMVTGYAYRLAGVKLMEGANGTRVEHSITLHKSQNKADVEHMRKQLMKMLCNGTVTSLYKGDLE